MFFYVLFCAFELLLLIRVILSWVKKEQANSFTILVCSLFRPILKPIRKILPANKVGIDFSPIILFIAIDIVKRLLFNSYF